MREKQDDTMYNNKGVYDHKGRWLSYYYQYSLVKKFNPKNILEVGIGSGITADYLKKNGFSVTTCDYEKNLNPDIVADITELPFDSNTFEYVMCCEVLEHIPFSDFIIAVKELVRVSSKHVYITVPDHRRNPFSIWCKLPFLNQIMFSMRVPTFKEHKFDGFHYWEIGHRGFSVSKIKNALTSIEGVNLLEEGSPEDCLMIHYFLLEKV